MSPDEKSREQKQDEFYAVVEEDTSGSVEHTVVVAGSAKMVCPECRETVEGTGHVCGLPRMPTKKFHPDSLPGTVLDGKYEVLNLLGAGGMSVVYKARDTLLNRFVAIKVLLGNRSHDSRAFQRFRQEARAAISLDHPNIIRTYEFQFRDGEQPYLVMEFLEGQSLLDVIKEERALNAKRGLDLMWQACDALKHAHKKGIIHRDLKPSNLMILRDDDGNELAKLVDFGIAKMRLQENEKRLTESGEVFGSPLYMSPEQCMGKELDPRSDVYSLGCMMYETLSGKAPFRGGSIVETAHMHLYDVPEPLATLRPHLTAAAEFDRIIAKCMAKLAEDRYQSIGEVQKDLEKVRNMISPPPQTSIPPRPPDRPERMSDAARALPKWVYVPIALLAVFGIKEAIDLSGGLRQTLLDQWNNHVRTAFPGMPQDDEGRFSSLFTTGQDAFNKGDFGTAQAKFKACVQFLNLPLKAESAKAREKAFRVVATENLLKDVSYVLTKFEDQSRTPLPEELQKAAATASGLIGNRENEKALSKMIRDLELVLHNYPEPAKLDAAKLQSVVRLCREANSIIANSSCSPQRDMAVHLIQQFLDKIGPAQQEALPYVLAQQAGKAWAHGDRRRAINYYNQSTPVLNPDSEPAAEGSDIEKGRAYLALYPVAKAQEKGEEAKAYIERAAQYLARAQVTPDAEIAQALDECEKSDRQAAVKRLKKLIQSLSEDAGRDDEKLVRSLEALAQAQAGDKATEAVSEPVIKRAIAMRNRITPDLNMQLLEDFFLLESIYKAMDDKSPNKYGKISSVFENELSLTEKIDGPRSPQVVVTLHNLAFSKVKENKPEEARALYERALSMKAALDRFPKVQAQVINDYAELLKRLGDSKRASEILHTAAKHNVN